MDYADLDLDAFMEAVTRFEAPSPEQVAKKVDQIRKLLAKAEGVGPDEARLFTAKATELMATYGVDQLMLSASGQVVDEIGDRRVDIPGPYALDKALLLVAMCKPLGVPNVRTDRSRSDVQMHLFGAKSTLDRVEMLFGSLLVQLARELAAVDRPAGTSAVSFAKNFYYGYAVQVMERLEALEVRAREDAQRQRTACGETSGSVAVALRDRNALVAAKFKEVYPRVSVRPMRRGSAGAAEGRAAGRRADLGGSRVGGGGRQAIGS